MKRESRFNFGSTLPKLPIISENGANKSCWALNFVQKSQTLPKLPIISENDSNKTCWALNFVQKSQTLPKLPIISENSSNKTCWTLNFVKKSQPTHMSIFPRSGAKGLGRLVRFKYYFVPKRKSRSIFRQNAAKITDYIKTLFKLKLLRITFHTQKLVGAFVYLHQEWI